MSQKNNRFEEEYFAKENLEQRHRLKDSQEREHLIEEKKSKKALHYMKCPKCGEDLHTVQHRFVQIDECKSCGAIVLDKGELEKILEAVLHNG